MWETLTLSAKEQQRSGIVSRWLAGIITTQEAVRLLGCSERTAWRLRAAMVTGAAAGTDAAKGTSPRRRNGSRGRLGTQEFPPPGTASVSG